MLRFRFQIIPSRFSKPSHFALTRASAISITFALSVLASSSKATDVIDANFSQPPQAVKLISESRERASFSVDIPTLHHEEVWRQGERFDRYSIENDPPAGPAGWPELPSLVRLVLIPPESGVELKVTRLQTHVVPNVNPFPRQPLTSDNELFSGQASDFLENDVPLIRDAHIDEVDGFWPNEIAALGKPAVMRGYRLVPVVINPVRFNPATREMEVVDQLEFELDYTSQLNLDNFVKNPGKARPSKAVDKLIRQIVVNPPPPPERDLGMRGGSILYVLGSDNQWNPIMDELDPLIYWRQKMGWTVNTLRVNNPQDANSTRRAIQWFYDEADVPPEHIVLCGDTDGNFPFGFFNHQAGAGYPYESDHDFTMLEGDDLLPEASVGRLIFNTSNMLRDIVAKTIQYEANPFIGEGNAQGWQKRAAVEAIGQIMTSPPDICRWTKRLMLSNDYTQVNELYWEQGGNERDNRQFVFDNINGGCSIFVHRGRLFMGTFAFADVEQLRNGRMLPFVMIITCNTGDYGEHNSSSYYFSERFSFHPNGGAIGAIGVAGANHTAYANLYVTGTMDALFTQGISNQGWAHVGGKLALYSHYFDRGDIPHGENRNMEAWLTQLYIVNLMGDPAVDLFTDVPRALAVTCPDALWSGDTHVEVTVLHEDDDSPALDATVCLYAGVSCQLVKHPDADGHVVFDIDPVWTERDSVFLTITGHNLLTSMTSYHISRADEFIGVSTFEIDDDNEGNSAGNGDGAANQLETIELAVNVYNYGRNNLQGELTLDLTTPDSELEVIDGEVVLQAAPARRETVRATFVVRIGGGFPSGENAVFNLTAANGDSTWESSVLVPVEGPALQFASLEWDGDILHRAESAELSVTLRNSGSVEVRPFRAVFFSRIRTIGAVNAEADYEAIDPDEAGESQSLFRVSAHPFHFGSRPVPVGLAIEADNGFIDTVLFDMPISDVVDGEPFGPDDYGYVCFDKTDTSWFAVPDFDWIEIDPRFDGDGTNTNLRDGRESEDLSVAVDLPFTFQYYGEEFDQITVCSNGWLAMGDCHELNSARNRHIPGPECPPGLIAPFWDDLIIPQNSGVFTWFDEANNQFIVEWSRLKKLGPQGNNEPEETFQVILLDPAHHASFTGDGDIIFQYLEITDNQSCFQTWDTPFASVGIASPDQTTGLEYIYWNARPGGAAPLQDNLAIKFTTLVDFRTGSLRGRVYDAATRRPIPEANIFTSFGFSTLTDNDGEFHIPEMLVDSSYGFRANKRFYNDSTLAGEIVEGEETVIEFGLLHPEFLLSVNAIEAQLLPDQQVEEDFTLTNTGNGPLDWTAEKRLPGDANAEPWELRRSYNVSQITDDDRIEGVVFGDDRYYLSGANGNDSNMIYIVNRDRELLDSFEQVGSARYGYKDMEWDDGLIWAAGEDSIYALDTEGEVVERWADPLNPSQYVGVDSERGVLYISGTTTNIIRCDRDGNQIGELLRRPGLRIYGLSYWPEDPDGYNLYILNRPSGELSFVTKMNTATGDTMTVFQFEQDSSSSGQISAAITRTFDVYSWVFMSIQNISAGGEGDKLQIHQLDGRKEWMELSVYTGRIEAGGVQELILTLDATDLADTLYEGEMLFRHNATPGMHRIPVNLHVVDTLLSAPPGDQAKLPLEFALQPAYPNPFNNITTIRFSLSGEGLTRLKIYDLTGKEAASLLDQPLKSGIYTINFAADGLASGVYICRLESGGKRAVRKVVMVK